MRLPGLQLVYDRLILGGLRESRLPKGKIELPLGDFRRPSLLVQLRSHIRQILAQSSNSFLEPLYRFPQSSRVIPDGACSRGLSLQCSRILRVCRRGLILLPSAS